MPRKKKTANDMTNDELAKRLFGKRLRDKIKEIARESDEKKTKKNHK